MNKASIKELSEKEMSQIRGGGSEEQWIYINGEWYLISGLSLGEDTTSLMPPPPNP